jgi:hypothetical protein
MKMEITEFIHSLEVLLGEIVATLISLYSSQNQ